MRENRVFALFWGDVRVEESMGGEMMNRKVLVVISAAVLLMLFPLVSPVLAAPAQKFAVVLKTSGSKIADPEKAWVTDGNISHTFGGIRGGPATLKIGANPTITGTYEETSDFNVNQKTHEMIGTFHKMLCTFPGGSFEGTKVARMVLDPVTHLQIAMEQHAVLQGSGIYEGQTLKIEQYWVAADPQTTKDYVGVLIVP